LDQNISVAQEIGNWEIKTTCIGATRVTLDSIIIYNNIENSQCNSLYKISMLVLYINKSLIIILILLGVIYL